MARNTKKIISNEFKDSSAFFKKKEYKKNDYTRILSIFALVISIISLIFNYYNQYGKKADLEFQVDNKIKIMNEKNDLGLIANITFFNNGARYGSVYKISGNVQGLRTKIITNFQWNIFLHDENIGIKGLEFKPFSSFEGYAKTFLIQGRTALQKQVKFKSDKKYIPTIGLNVLELNFYTNTSKTPIKIKKTFFISKKDIENYKNLEVNYDSINHINHKSISLNLKDFEN